MLRFLKLIACDNSKIGTYAKLVDDRNESAHPNGKIFYSTQGGARHQDHGNPPRGGRNPNPLQAPSSSTVTRSFSSRATTPKTANIPITLTKSARCSSTDNYLSQKDIEICAAFDISEHKTHLDFPGIESLHQTLRATYVQREDTPSS